MAAILAERPLARKTGHSPGAHPLPPAGPEPEFANTEAAANTETEKTAPRRGRSVRRTRTGLVLGFPAPPGADPAPRFRQDCRMDRKQRTACGGVRVGTPPDKPENAEWRSWTATTSREPVSPFLAGKALDGIAQRGGVDGGNVFAEEAAKGGRVLLAAFAQHPADGLVHQVVRMPERGDALAERLVEFTPPDECECGDYGDPVLPERRATRQPVEKAARTIEQMPADKRRRGKVDEVPVVHAVLCRRGEVEAVDRRPFAFGRASEPFDEQEERAFAGFVPRRGEQRLDRRVVRVQVRLRDSPDLRDHHAEEPVPFAVFAGAGLEESR